MDLRPLKLVEKDTLGGFQSQTAGSMCVDMAMVEYENFNTFLLR